MGTIYINARCQMILNLLLAEANYLTMQRIADKVKVSKRSVYYDLYKINEWLGFYQLPELEVQRGKGLYIPSELKQKIERILQDECRSEHYIFSPMERVKTIICYIIYLGVPVYIEQLSRYCQVSRNTIFNDLRVVVSQLQEYGLSLAYESKKGYYIEGDIVRIRALFLSFFHDLKPLFDSGILNFINSSELKTNLHKLKSIERQLPTEYVDGILSALASLLPLMYKSKEKPYFPNLKKEKIEYTQEYKLTLLHFPDLESKEQIYLCLHLLGSRVAVVENDIFDHSADQTVYAITKALVAEFEKIACIIFEDREELERALFVHISTSLYRYQYGIQVGNPISTDVMREYPSLVDITRRVSKYLAQIVGMPIPDSEVAYLALHFGAYLKISNPIKEPLRILIVCVNGISTGNMLRREVQKLLPNARILDVVAAIDVVNIQNICDLVIATVKINSEVPVIVVQPILSDMDRKAILDFVKPEKKMALKESDRVFERIKKYIKKEDYSRVKADLTNYFNDASVEWETGSPQNRGLLYFLEQNEITIVRDTCTWQEAVWKAGGKLIEKGSVEKKYLDTIISQIQYYGPYMFVAQGVLLAHAKPEDGVKRLDVSLMAFQVPVIFSDHHKASLIITLAAEDQESHLKILRDIIDVFAEEEDKRPEKMAAMENHSQIYRYLEQYISLK